MINNLFSFLYEPVQFFFFVTLSKYIIKFNFFVILCVYVEEEIRKKKTINN